MLLARGLTKAYRGQTVVSAVDLSIEPGRVVGLVGANGAGKTTTIKMLCGLLEPSSGTATIDGQPTTEAPARRHLGYLPEESPLYDDLSPVAYLAFFGGLYDVPRQDIRSRTRALLTRFRLAERDWKRPLGTLSKGMRRKVAIARCLLHEPSILLLDEPTSGLDPLTSAELGEFVRDLRAQGKGVLMSAHNLPQVEELCDEILVMHAGKIIDRGTLAELRGRIGKQRYRVRATTPFPQSEARGTLHEAWLQSLPEVEAALQAVRQAKGIVLEVESVPPRLEEILRRASGA